MQPDYGGEIQALRQELATLRSQQQSTRDQVTNALSKRLRDEFTSIDRLAKRNNWSAAEIADQKAKARAEALDAIATEEPASGAPGVPPGTPPPVPTAAYPTPATQSWEVPGAASKVQAAAAILDYVADYDLQDDDPETATLIARYSGKQYSSPTEYRAMLREFKRDVHKQVTAKEARLQQDQISGQRRAEATEARTEVERHGALGSLNAGGSVGVRGKNAQLKKKLQHSGNVADYLLHEEAEDGG